MKLQTSVHLFFAEADPTLKLVSRVPLEHKMTKEALLGTCSWFHPGYLQEQPCQAYIYAKGVDKFLKRSLLPELPATCIYEHGR